jgi:hypothetical protein
MISKSGGEGNSRVREEGKIAAIQPLAAPQIPPLARKN